MPENVSLIDDNPLKVGDLPSVAPCVLSEWSAIRKLASFCSQVPVCR